MNRKIERDNNRKMKVMITGLENEVYDISINVDTGDNKATI